MPPCMPSCHPDILPPCYHGTMPSYHHAIMLRARRCTSDTPPPYLTSLVNGVLMCCSPNNTRAIDCDLRCGYRAIVLLCHCAVVTLFGHSFSLSSQVPKVSFTPKHGVYAPSATCSWPKTSLTRPSTAASTLAPTPSRRTVVAVAVAGAAARGGDSGGGQRRAAAAHGGGGVSSEGNVRGWEVNTRCSSEDSVSIAVARNSPIRI